MQHTPSPYMRRYRIPHLGFRVDDAPPPAASSSLQLMLPPQPHRQQHWCRETDDAAAASVGFMRYEEAEQLLSPMEIQSKLELIHMKNRELLRFHSTDGKAELNNNINNGGHFTEKTIENPACRFTFSPVDHQPSSSSFTASIPPLPTLTTANKVPCESLNFHLRSPPAHGRTSSETEMNALRSLAIVKLTAPSVVTNASEPDENSDEGQKSRHRRKWHRKSRNRSASSSVTVATTATDDCSTKDGLRGMSLTRRTSSLASSTPTSSSTSFSSTTTTVSSIDFLAAAGPRTSSTLPYDAHERGGRGASRTVITDADEGGVPMLLAPSIWRGRRRATSEGPPSPPPLFGIAVPSRRRRVFDWNANQL